MKRRCPNCSEVLAPNANFCRACGARYAAAKSPPAQPVAAYSGPEPTSRRSPVAIVIGAVILVVGVAVAVAVLLGSGDDSSTTTVVRQAEAPAGEGVADTEANTGSTGPLASGRYVQAGSFQTSVHAEEERRRLAAQGVDVEVVPSDLAEELYPGFQVLLGGPIRSRATERTLLQGLHRNGVPSAFARELTPATSGGGAPAAAGNWSGQLERTSSEDPKLSGPLPANLTLSPDGTAGSLDLASIGCRASLTLVSEANQVLDYSQEPACAGAGTVRVRPLTDELMLTLLSPSTDTFSLGTLNRG
jgi:hypothetical protein